MTSNWGSSEHRPSRAGDRSPWLRVRAGPTWLPTLRAWRVEVAVQLHPPSQTGPARPAMCRRSVGIGSLLVSFIDVDRPQAGIAGSFRAEDSEKGVRAHLPFREVAGETPAHVSVWGAVSSSA